MIFWKQIINRINNSYFFDSTRKERRQVVSVLVFTSVILFGGKIYSEVRTVTANSQLDSNIVALLLAADTVSVSSNADDSLNRLDRYIVDRYSQLKLFNFDPNTVSEDDLLKLGFTTKQASTLLKYRQNGGRFKTIEDFRRLYGLRYKQFQILRPYVSLPEGGRQVPDRNDAATSGKSTSPEHKTSVQPPDTSKKSELFTFDPNFVSEQDMYRLGFYTKQIESFMKMREQGKKFYCKGDFAKLYFVDDKRFKQLEPYITIDIERLCGHKAFDINTVDAETLAGNIDIPLKDAQKLIELRGQLGGFYSLYQIRDCGIKYDKANDYIPYLYICQCFKINKININALTEDQLRQHPYISDKQASAIAKYQSEKGKLMHIEDLRSLYCFDKNELSKIEHYFSFK